MTFPVPEYPKIYGPFKRSADNPKTVDRTKWTRPEFEWLQHLPWDWTEKLDGTNIRIHWDGHRVAIGGRTDNAQIPAPLIEWINTHLPEELFEDVFQSTEVSLYGEGLGGKIQRMGKLYGESQHFRLFDVRIGGWWLERANVFDIAAKLNIDSAPFIGTLSVPEAIQRVSYGYISKFSTDETVYFAEGLVGRPAVTLLDPQG